MNWESVNGKNDDFIDSAPTSPNAKKASITTFTATGNLIKYAIIFFISIIDYQ